MRVTVRVPATAANLGPGFDTFGLALDLCNEVTVDTTGPAGVGWDGEGAGELAVDGSDLTGRVMAVVAGRMSLPIAPHDRRPRARNRVGDDDHHDRHDDDHAGEREASLALSTNPCRGFHRGHFPAQRCERR